MTSDATRSYLDRMIDRANGETWDTPYQTEATRNGIKVWARANGQQEPMAQYGAFRAVVRFPDAVYVVEIVPGGATFVYRERKSQPQPSEAVLDFLFGGVPLEVAFPA